MGLFAGLMTYLAAAALLVGSAVISVSTLLSPSETTEASSAAKAPGKLVRTTERKPEASKPDASKAAVSPQSDAAPLGPAVNHMPADPPRLGNAERAKKQAQSSQAARKKKIARQAPREPVTATATLGYGPEQRRFVFPMDPGW